MKKLLVLLILNCIALTACSKQTDIKQIEEPVAKTTEELENTIEEDSFITQMDKDEENINTLNLTADSFKIVLDGKALQLPAKIAELEERGFIINKEDIVSPKTGDYYETEPRDGVLMDSQIRIYVYNPTNTSLNFKDCPIVEIDTTVRWKDNFVIYPGNIIKGVTTKNEVLERLGEPITESTANNLYEYFQKPNDFAESLKEDYDKFTIYFDDENVVKDIDYRKGLEQEDINTESNKETEKLYNTNNEMVYGIDNLMNHPVWETIQNKNMVNHPEDLSSSLGIDNVLFQYEELSACTVPEEILTILNKDMKFAGMDDVDIVLKEQGNSVEEWESFLQELATKPTESSYPIYHFNFYTLDTKVMDESNKISLVITFHNNSYYESYIHWSVNEEDTLYFNLDEYGITYVPEKGYSGNFLKKIY